MKRYVIDTNHLGMCVTAVSLMRDRILQRERTGDVFATCGSVICELMSGLVRVHDAEKSRRRVKKLLEHVRVWPIELATAYEFGIAYQESRTSGRVFSHPDLLLVSLARMSDAIVLTSDLDFRAFPDVATEDWTIAPAG